MDTLVAWAVASHGGARAMRRCALDLWPAPGRPLVSVARPCSGDAGCRGHGWRGGHGRGLQHPTCRAHRVGVERRGACLPLWKRWGAGTRGEAETREVCARVSAPLVSCLWLVCLCPCRFPEDDGVHTGLSLMFCFASARAFCLLPNARRQARLEAGARYERALEAVACTPLFGQDSTPEIRKSGSFAF